MPVTSLWPLHEDSGSTANDKRGSRDAAHNGGTDVSNAGIHDSTSYYFNGSDAYLSTTFNIDSMPMVWFSLWYKPNATGSCKLLSWGENASYSQANLGIDSNMKPFFEIGDGGSITRATGVSTLSTGSWYQLFGGFTENRHVGIGMNGEAHAFSTFGTKGDPDSNFNIGRKSHTGDEYADGYMMNVVAYDHEVTPAVMQAVSSAPYDASYTTGVK